MEAIDVGRGVQSGAVAGLLQDGGGHRCGASLAVGARDVDEFQLLFGIAHAGQQLSGAPQTGRAALPADRMDVFNGLVCVHEGSFFRIQDCFSRASGGQTSMRPKIFARNSRKIPSDLPRPALVKKLPLRHRAGRGAVKRKAVAQQNMADRLPD